MSKLSKLPLRCSCGNSFEASVFKSANVTLDPNLKDRILARKFNVVRCPSCQHDIDAEVPFLYHDMTGNLLVWVYPAGRASESEQIRDKIRKSMEIVRSVLPGELEPGREVVFGIDELVRLISA